MESQGGEDYSSYSFTTSALDWGEWLASRPVRALAPGTGPPVPIVQEVGWAPEPVSTQRLEENLLPLPEIEPWSPRHPVRSQTLFVCDMLSYILMRLIYHVLCQIYCISLLNAYQIPLFAHVLSQNNLSNLYSSVVIQSLKGPPASNTGDFFNLFRHAVILLLTWDQPITKTSTYTGQHNTERRGQTSMPWARFEHTGSASKRPGPTPQTAQPLGPTEINWK
jgi:hypothetical protein